MIKTFTDRRTRDLFLSGTAKRFPPDVALKAGDRTQIGIAMDRFHLFDPQTGNALR